MFFVREVYRAPAVGAAKIVPPCIRSPRAAHLEKFSPQKVTARCLRIHKPQA